MMVGVGGGWTHGQETERGGDASAKLTFSFLFSGGGGGGGTQSIGWMVPLTFPLGLPSSVEPLRGLHREPRSVSPR